MTDSSNSNDSLKSGDSLKIGLAQIAPVWLNKAATIEKALDTISQAAEQGCELVAFGEAFLPGYPFWLELTGGAEFNSPVQKTIHSHYMANAIDIEAGDLQAFCDIAKQKQIAIYLGIIERPGDRGGHSLYCSMVYISASGEVCSVHRKLMPTYEERLTWSPGDGHGLRTHKLRAFTVGGLNCWENWMPLPRAALYGMGEDLHVAIWPGGAHNTHDITRFIAKENRGFCVSVSSVMRPQDFPSETPYLDKILERVDKEFLANGGSCVSGPDGSWVLEPQIGVEGLFTAQISHHRVREERQNFDPVGHYSRPDVTQLQVNRERQSTVVIND